MSRDRRAIGDLIRCDGCDLYADADEIERSDAGEMLCRDCQSAEHNYGMKWFKKGSDDVRRQELQDGEGTEG